MIQHVAIFTEEKNAISLARCFVICYLAQAKLVYAIQSLAIFVLSLTIGLEIFASSVLLLFKQIIYAWVNVP